MSTEPRRAWQPGDPIYTDQPAELVCDCGVRVLWRPDTPQECPECGKPLAAAPAGTGSPTPATLLDGIAEVLSLPPDYSREAVELPQRILAERNAYAVHLAQALAGNARLRQDLDRARAELSQVQRERDDARETVDVWKERAYEERLGNHAAEDRYRRLADASGALAARMHANDPLNRRADRVWARELREAIAATAPEAAPARSRTASSSDSGEHADPATSDAPAQDKATQGGSGLSIGEVGDDSVAINLLHQEAAQYAHERDAAESALTALRADHEITRLQLEVVCRTVVEIADDYGVKAERLGPPTDETSGPDRVAWLLCDEICARLRALVTDRPQHLERDHRDLYWALRTLVELKDGPRNEEYEERKPKAWQRARDVIAAADATLVTDQSPAAPRGYKSSDGRPFVSHDPAMRSGEATLNHTRLSIDAIAGYVWAGETVEAVMATYDITRADVMVACWWIGTFGPKRWRRRWGAWAEDVHDQLWHSKFDVPDPPIPDTRADLPTFDPSQPLRADQLMPLAGRSPTSDTQTASAETKPSSEAPDLMGELRTSIEQARAENIARRDTQTEGSGT